MALAWGFISYFGAVGAGIAFFASYIFHALLTYAIASRLTRFCWSDDNLGTGLLFSSVIALVFCALYLLPSALALTLGSIAAIVCGVYSVRVLLKIIPVHELPRPLRQLLARAPAQNLGWRAISSWTVIRANFKLYLHSSRFRLEAF
jgi:antigen flippase